MAGGAEGGWQGQRTSVSAGYSRSISDGGGVLGAVRLQTVHGNFRRELVPGWAVALNASHGTNQSITVPFANSASSINLTSAGISLERNVGKSIGLRMGYSHDFQEQFGVPGTDPDAQCEPKSIFCDAFVPVGQTFRNVVMEEELQESSELLDFAEIKGIVRRRRWQFLVPFFLRLAAGVGSELADSLDLPVGHAHSGRAAFGTGEICCRPTSTATFSISWTALRSRS